VTGKSSLKVRGKGSPKKGRRSVTVFLLTSNGGIEQQYCHDRPKKGIINCNKKGQRKKQVTVLDRAKTKDLGKREREKRGLYRVKSTWGGENITRGFKVKRLLRTY